MELPDGRVRKVRTLVNRPGLTHMLTFTCKDGMRLLRHDRTRMWMIDAMERSRRKHDLRIIAYVIMLNHVHIILRSLREVYSISDIRKSLKQGVSRRAVAWLRYNSPSHLERLLVVWPTGRREYRFWEQGGGHDRSLWSRRALLNAVKYIHRNPVRAGLVKKAVDWEWSSARSYAGREGVVMKVDRLRLGG